MEVESSTILHQNVEPRLIVSGLSCVRGDRLLFKDLEFELAPGQAGLVSGPNGVGKSSLLRLIAGLLIPFSGKVTTAGSVALCDDKLALDENLPFEKALQFWADLDGRPGDVVAAAMAAVGLKHLAIVPIRYFSTGQRQRARLARTYVSGADLWLLDEPANGLDSASIDLLGTAMQDHLERGGMIMAASHFPLPISFDFTLQLDPLEQQEIVS